ncbi:MAG: A/G-specific adenine glycosylase [bacterium]|nr:A/G-specific adenine glycosylase [bacterium]
MSEGPSQKEIRAFQLCVRKHFRVYGRVFPWRKTRDPYHILVSEMMLQQTQTVRVVQKYTAFIQRFPTVESLAGASLLEVFSLWQGLGYNRRARMLRDSARIVVSDYGGSIPRGDALLQTLPGVGPYTARAVASFAFGMRTCVIETNIRAVYLHHFFPHEHKVADTAIATLVMATLPQRNIRDWYNALMDYGAYIKATHPNPGRRSKHHATQSRFEGSVRQVRGAIIRVLVREESCSLSDLHTHIGYDVKRVREALASLKKEGTIVVVSSLYRLAK